MKSAAKSPTKKPLKDTDRRKPLTWATRTAHIRSNVAPNELEKIVEAAAQNSMTTSDFVRAVVMSAIHEKKPIVTGQITF